ncbi:MAG: DNA polymerase III subunit gamma/tau [Candidatus Geothermincolia bacterium]
MEHITLYRKWRPQTFSEVVGQARVTNTLANALSSGRLVHAYLFSGPRGTGKTSTARILAKAINCVEGPTATPCGVCDACVSISEGTALDVIEIDAASNRKIDEIRDLLDKIPYTPTALRTKVYIVDEVHQLTPEASSALLKTLEEPPGHVIFVLATTEPHKLLPTIVSRCQKFDFSLVSAARMEQLLEHIASREGIDIEGEALGMIAEHAHGSVRDAIGVMDQISNLSGERISQEQLAEMLGEVEASLVFEMIDLIADRDTAGALTVVGRMVEGGTDPRRFVEALISHLRALFLVQNAANPSEVVEATVEHYARLELQAASLRRSEVMRLMERLGDAHREMRWSESPRLVLECVLVKITSIDADATLEGLAFRIEELEKKIDALAGGSGPVRLQVEAPAVAPAPAVKKPAGPKAAGKELKAAAPETAPAEVEIPGESGEKNAAHEPAAAGTGPESTPAEREKARRAWTAVLTELKSLGQMKLYALLVKARVVSTGSGELVLGFGEDASFQMEALQESGDLAKVEETWARFTGEPVKVKLSRLGSRATADPVGAPAPREVKTPPQRPAAKPPSIPEQRVDASSDVAEDAAREPKPETSGVESGPAREEKAPGAKSPAEIARIFKERFDGEIIEQDKEGKE